MNYEDINPTLEALASDSRLRVCSGMETYFLNLPEFKTVVTEELIYRAKVRLGLARLGSIQGIRVTDRAMAVAILVGMPDRTEFGL